MGDEDVGTTVGENDELAVEDVLAFIYLHATHTSTISPVTT